MIPIPPPPLFPPEALPRDEYLDQLRAQTAPPVIPPPIAPPVPVWQLPAGTTMRAALYHTTVLPDLDFETYSEAGYVWDAGRMKWGCLRGTDKKGLGVVGAQVYAEHPSTEVLSLYYDLKDGRRPAPLVAHGRIAAGGAARARGARWLARGVELRL